MNWVDIFILAVIGVSAVISLFRGLVSEVLSLLAWVIAFWVAFVFAGPVSSLAADLISVPSARMALGFVCLFVGTLIVCGTVNFLISKLIATTGLTGTDRMLGILFGIARGIAIITVLVVLAGLTPITRDPWWRESVFLGHFVVLASAAISLLPVDFATYFSY